MKDNYTSSYLGSSGNKLTPSSHELITILMEEDQQRKGQNSDLATSLQAKQGKGKETGKSTGDPNVECYNCHKKGHMSKDCWAKGGGKEGQGPKGQKGQNKNRLNQAQEANLDLNEASESIRRWKYYISFTDDCTQYVHVLFLKDKGQVFDCIKERVAQIKCHCGKVPKWLHFDNEKELVNDKLNKLAADKGIIIETSAPYSPSQKGVPERFNWTLLELARAMLISSNLPTFLWDEAVAHAAYLQD